MRQRTLFRFLSSQTNMQEPSSKNKKGLYRLRRADPHERLSARLRHFSFGAAVVFVVAAAGIVIHSLYNIQIKNGATFRQYAAQQQLLDSTIQATQERRHRRGDQDGRPCRIAGGQHPDHPAAALRRW